MSAISYSDRPVWRENLRFSALFGAEPVYAALGLACFFF
jgi:hypothetical protein